MNAKHKDTAVFALMPSPRNNHVNIVKIMIPVTNDKKRAGQNCPSNASTAVAVARINNHVIGTPNTINAQRYCFANGHMIGPFT